MQPSDTTRPSPIQSTPSISSSSSPSTNPSTLLGRAVSALEHTDLPMPPIESVSNAITSSPTSRKGKEKDIELNGTIAVSDSPPPSPPLSPRSRPARPILWFERLLQKRLEDLVQEKDVLGEAVAKLHARIRHKKGKTAQKLQALLPKLLLPSELLAEQRQSLLAKTIPEEALQPILGLMQELRTARQNRELKAFETEIDTIITYYESFVAELKSAKRKKRQRLLAPKAQICGDQLGFYLIDPSLARQLLCRDQCGEVAKENAYGVHAVAAVGGIHFKPNPKKSLTAPFIAPGQEYAVGTLWQLFSRRKLIAAPTTLIKVRHTPFTTLAPEQPDTQALQAFNQLKRQGMSADEIFKANPDLRQRLQFTPNYGERVVQGGFTIGYHKGSLPSAACLQSIVEIVDTMKMLKQTLGKKALVAAWPKIETLCSKKSHSKGKEPVLSAEQLHERYFAFMNRFPATARCLDFKKPEELTQEEQRTVRCLLQWPKERQVGQLQYYLQQTPSTDWLDLLALLEIAPKVMESKRLEELLELPRILRFLLKFLPKSSPEHTVTQACTLLDKLDHEAFSALCVGSLITTPTDGKADNYMVEISRNKKGAISSLQIVGIDNDMALKPSIEKYGSAGQELHALKHHCLLYAMMNMMKSPLHPEVRRLLLEPPEALVLTWLVSIDQRNLRYQEMRRQGVINSSDLKEEGECSLDIPIRIREGIANVVYQKLQAAQKAIRENPQLTHNELFQAIDPIAHLCYQRILEKKQPLLDTQLAIRRGPSAEELLGKESHLLTTLPLPEPVGAFQTPAHEAKKWIRNLDWKRIPIPLQARLLEQVSQLSFVKRLPITTAKPDLLLQQAARQMLPGLAELSLRSGAQADVKDEAERSLLHILVQAAGNPDLDQEQVIATAQILFGNPATRPNTRDEQGLPPLFYLIGSASPKLIEQLLQLFVAHGADLELADPLKDETLLDKAISRDKPHDFMALIALGAGVRVRPGPALVFAKKHRKVKGMKKALKRLKRQSSRVAWTLATSSLMLPKKPKGKALKLQGNRIGDVYLHPEVTAQLKLTKSGTFPQKEKGQFGRRTVIAVSHEGHQIHLKENPEWPGVEHAVHTFHERVIGHGTPQSELFKASDAKGSPYPILASQTIEGDNFHDILRSDEASEKLAELDLHRLHNLILTAMLINPEDAKPDNFICTPFINHEGKKRLQLVSVDNDHAFVPPLTKNKLGRTRLQVKCILYCMDQMKEPLHPKTRELFLRLDPAHLLEGWLRELSVQEERYASLFSQKERQRLYKRKKNPIVIPIPFPPGSIANLFEKLTRIQRVLRNEGETPLSLLRQTIPGLGVRYEEAFNHGENPLSRFRHLTLTLYSTAIIGRFGTKINSKQVLKSLRIPQQAILERTPKYRPSQALDELRRIAQQAKTLDRVRQALLSGNSKPFEQLLIGEFRDEVIAGIDFSTRPKQEGAILKILSVIGATRRLHLKSSQINDAQLNAILDASPALTELELPSCSKLSGAALKKVASACPYLEVLELTDAKKVRDFRGSTFPRLKQLTLDSCGELQRLTIKTPRLTRLSMKDCHSLYQLRVASNVLEYAALNSCRALTRKDIEPLVAESSQLKRLAVRGCTAIPEARWSLTEQYPVLMFHPVETFNQELLTELQGIANESLLELDLRNNYAGDEGAKALAAALSKNSSLTKLNLWNNNIGDEGAKVLGDALSKNSTLTILNLEGSGVGAKGSEGLGVALSKNSSLKTLSLMNNRIGDDGTEVIATALFKNNSLTNLHLGSNSIGDEGAKALAVAISKNSSLTKLKLWRNGVGDEGAKAFGAALSKNSSLTKLDLSQNRVGIEGAKALAAALARNSALTDLKILLNPLARAWLNIFNGLVVDEADFTNAGLGTQGAVLLGAVLAQNSVLTTLNLGRNDIGDKGAKALGTALIQNSSLTKLLLWENEIGDEGAKALAVAISKNSSLTTLDLRSNSVSDEGAKALGAALTQNSTLTNLDLKGTRIGMKGIEVLEKDPRARYHY